MENRRNAPILPPNGIVAQTRRLIYHEATRLAGMLSTNYRLRLQFICNRIATGQTVELEDRIWATKLGAANRTAATMLRQAERRAQNPDMKEGDMDDFLNQLDIGGTGGEAKGIRRFESPDQIADFFRQDKPSDWRQRD